MTHVGWNPFAAPESTKQALTSEEPSFWRVVLCVIAWSIAGFATMYGAIAISQCYRENAFQYPRRLPLALSGLHETAFWPSVTCSLTFAVAAVLNFAPQRRLGMFPSLLYAGCYTTVGLIVMVVATTAFRLDPRSYDSDPWWWLRAGIAYGVLISLGAKHIIRRYRVFNDKSPIKELNRSGGTAGIDMETRLPPPG